MRKTLIPIALLPLSVAAHAQEAKRPNVIIVMSDDQGKGDLACQGNPYIQTPNIDAFHNEAVRFTNFHVSPTSGPTRAALMTGRFTDRTNCFHTVAGRDRVYEDEVMMPQVFAANGYKTAMFGKWHMGDTYPYRPEDRGFQEVVRLGGGGVGQSPDYWGNDYFDDTYWHNSVPEKYNGYCTDVFFDQTLNFVEKNADEPFFCYLALNAPHGPLNVPEEYYNIYKNNKHLKDNEKRFYGMITNLDDNFKRLDDKLEELGIADNTILIFMTDNGTAAGYRACNGGMRGTKNSEYDGGHCVPFYVRWNAGGVNGGKDVKRVAAHIDLLPTFIDVCDLNYAEVKPLDGESIAPLMVDPNAKTPKRAIITDSQRLQNLVKWRKSSVMTDNWRLVNGTELYDMDADPLQVNDIAASHPEMVKELRNEYELWWASLNVDAINNRHAPIWVGTEYENPVRFSAHEIHTGFIGKAWEQNGVMKAELVKGHYKIRVMSDGDYKITLCRYPLESGHAINEQVPAVPYSVEVPNPHPASDGVIMTQSHLHIAQIEGKPAIQQVGDTDKGMEYTTKLYSGYYDMEASFNDKEGRVYPAYYVYIEKL